MESPRMRYAKGHGHGYNYSSSSSKRPFSSTTTKHLRHVKLSKKLSKISRRYENTTKLPLHLKRPNKMASTTTSSSPKASPSSPSALATASAAAIPAVSSSPSSPKRPHQEDGTDPRPSKKAKVSAQRPVLPSLGNIKQVGNPQWIVPANATVYISDVDERGDSPSNCQLLRRKKLLSKYLGSSSNRPVFILAPQKGMKNSGVLCYRNSLLQSVLHQPKFVNWVMGNHGPEDCVFEKEFCVACAVRDLAVAYGHPGHLDREVDQNHRLFRTLGWSAGPSGQGDPEEHLGWIVNQVSYQIPKTFFRQFESFFNTTSNNSINCRCGYSSVTENNTFGAIPVDLQPRAPGSTLSGYLDRTFNGIVTGYKCESCGNEKTDKTKTSRITHFPDLLVLALKRFNCLGQKDNIKVKFNETINLDVLAHKANAQNANYHLSAVVAHCGNVNFGHYVAAVKCEDGKWRLFNDDRVSVVSVQEALGAKRGFDPYLLFWKRVEGEII